MTDSVYISVINHILIQEDLGEGVYIIPNHKNHNFPSIKLTNNQDVIKSLVTPNLKPLIGQLEYENFFKPNTLIVYSKSQFDETKTNSIDYLDLNFYLIRIFFLCLWLVKDNSIDFDLGFLYYSDAKSGFTTSSNIFSSSNFTCHGNRELITFSTEEIKNATNTLQENIIIEKQSHKIGNLNGFGRVGIAIYFIQHARSCSDLGLKMTSYCSSLETLFSNDNTELSHKLAERVAHFLSQKKEKRIDIFKQMKKAYDFRSKVIHGTIFKSEQEKEIECLIIEIDSICREIIKYAIEKNDMENVFIWPNEKHEKYFLELIMS